MITFLVYEYLVGKAINVENIGFDYFCSHTKLKTKYVYLLDDACYILPMEKTDTGRMLWRNRIKLHYCNPEFFQDLDKTIINCMIYVELTLDDGKRIMQVLEL